MFSRSNRYARNIAAAHLALDDDEEQAALCPVCREADDDTRCIACGAALGEQNAAFDTYRFNLLRKGGAEQ